MAAAAPLTVTTSDTKETKSVDTAAAASTAASSSSSAAPAGAAAASATADGASSPSSPASPVLPSTSYPKNRIKVLLLEGVSQLAIDAFVQEGYQVTSVREMDEEQLVRHIKGVHALGIRSKTQVTRRVLEAADKLLAVGAFCIGTDQTDLEAAASNGVCVFNAPFANTRSVAEMVLAEMICLARQLMDRSHECHRKVWNKVSGGCYEVRGKTAGIIGYGHVGSQLSILCEALGMHVIYYDIIPKLAMGNARAVSSLDELLRQSDFVTLHVPGGKETTNLIGAREVALMKPGSYLLNASRGKVVDIEPVAAALRSKHLAGVAFDVFPVEPPPIKDAEFKSALQGLPNTILTPHIGGSTEEAQSAIGREVSQKIISYINTGASVGSVNFPQVQLPTNRRAHRILNVHHNVPGVLRDVNNVLSEYNVVAQMLLTTETIGYLMVEVNRSVSGEVKEKMSKLASNIRTRVLF